MALVITALSGLLAFAGAAEAAPRFARSTGNWTAVTWSATSCAAGTGAAVPAVGDDVTICSGNTVTLNTNTAALASLTVENTATLQFDGTARNLSVSGNITVNGTLAVQNLTATHTLTLGGNITNNGTLDLRLDNNSLCNTTFNGSGPQVIGGTSSGLTRFNNMTVTNSLTINKSGGAVTQVGTMTVGGNLLMQAGTLDQNGTSSVTGTHSVNAGATHNSANSLTVTGLTTVGGTLSITNAAGAVTFSGGMTINSGGAFNNNLVTEPITMGGNFTNNGTFNAGNNTYTFNSAGQWAGSSGLNFGTGTVTVSANRSNNTTASFGGTLAITGAVTLTNNATATVAGAITGSVAGSTWTNATNSTLNITGALLATGTLNASASGNTIDFRATGNQTIKQASGNQYFNLIFSNGGTDAFPTAGSTQNILGSLTINAGATLSADTNDNIINITGGMTVGGTYLASNIAGRTLTVGGNLIVDGTFTGNAAPVNLGGNFTHNGTFTSGAGGFTFNGSAAQALDGTATNTTFATMGMSNTAAFASRKLTLSHDITVTTLNFNAAAGSGGRIVTGAAKVIVPSGGAINNASGSATESDFIAGRLQRFVPTGTSTVDFPVGTDGAALPAAGYTPASLAFTGVGAGGGSLIVQAVQSDHPNIATSGLDAAKSVNRYWSLTTAGVSGTALPAFTNYGATLTFIGGAAPAGDLDSGANTANFEIERFSAGTWNTTTTGARTATTTQATGITALGDLAIAEKKVIIPDPGDFNAFESSTAANAITGRIFTKLVGVNFSLDIVAILSGAQHATFTNTVAVDLVTGSSGGLNCPGTPVAIAGTSQNVNLTNGRGTTAAFNIAGTAYRDVRVRVRFPTVSPTVTSCSTDNFSIRPTAFTVTSTNATQTGTSGGPTIKTGAFFNLTATALPGYDGTPAINNALVTGTPAAGAIGGSFGAATVGTGIASGNSFFYSEVGHVGLGANAVFDSGFAGVDSPAGDCTNDFSNTLVGGRYGCNFGSTAVPQVTGSSGFGRFIPDNFSVSYNVPVLAPACTGFTYVGQSFNYTTVPVITVTARNGTNNGLTNATTVNYAGSYAKFTNAVLAVAPYDTQAGRYARHDALGGGLTPVLDSSGLPSTGGDPVISAFASGVGTFTFAGGSGLRFTRSAATPSAPFDADIALAINVVDADGVAFAGNPAVFGAATAGNGMLFSDANPATTNDKRVRYGRLRVGSTSGSQVLPLRVPVEAQYWNGTSFTTNTLDSCTVLAAGNVGLGNYTGNLNAGETTATITASPLQSGRSAIQLSAPGAGNFGGVDVTLNLGSGANADACNGFAPAATAGNLAHLRGLWCAPPGTYSKDPAARVRFGATRSSDQTIYRREQ
jgi:MSHA biogenesis protein MshQ